MSVCELPRRLCSTQVSGEFIETREGVARRAR